MDVTECKDKRKCFAKVPRNFRTGCSILIKGYRDGKCPFCKPDRDVTDGKRYSHEMHYNEHKAWTALKTYRSKQK
jgi:hypothetical protein